MGHRTIYSNTFQTLQSDGTYLKELQKLQNRAVLILDNLGLHAFDTTAREIILDIIDDRLTEKSTLLSSQLSVSKWNDIIRSLMQSWTDS